MPSHLCRWRLAERKVVARAYGRPAAAYRCSPAASVGARSSPPDVRQARGPDGARCAPGVTCGAPREPAGRYPSVLRRSVGRRERCRSRTGALARSTGRGALLSAGPPAQAPAVSAVNPLRRLTAPRTRAHRGDRTYADQQLRAFADRLLHGKPPWHQCRSPQKLTHDVVSPRNDTSRIQRGADVLHQK
jgi:hypothetical protein